VAHGPDGPTAHLGVLFRLNALVALLQPAQPRHAHKPTDRGAVSRNNHAPKSLHAPNHAQTQTQTQTQTHKRSRSVHCISACVTPAGEEQERQERRRGQGGATTEAHICRTGAGPPNVPTGLHGVLQHEPKGAHKAHGCTNNNAPTTMSGADAPHTHTHTHTYGQHGATTPRITQQGGKTTHR
jgi:hypothetical protein